MDPLNVLVVEDGEEYIRTFSRFGSDELHFSRAGDGREALARLVEGPEDGRGAWDVVFLDMRFDRVPPGALLGDLSSTAERFNGDPNRARQFLEEHQGTYILAAIRAAGHTLPAIFSHDFDPEPRRWANLVKQYAPVHYLPDNASAATLQALILTVARR